MDIVGSSCVQMEPNPYWPVTVVVGRKTIWIEKEFPRAAIGHWREHVDYCLARRLIELSPRVEVLV